MQDTARRIARVSAEAKIELDEETYVESFKPQMMDVVNAWASGATFGQICKMTDAFEGRYFNVPQHEPKRTRTLGSEMSFLHIVGILCLSSFNSDPGFYKHF